MYANDPKRKKQCPNCLLSFTDVSLGCVRKYCYECNANAIRCAKYKLNNPEVYRAINMSCMKNTRMKALAIVDPKLQCANCGCQHIELLEINHKHGGGNKEKKQTRKVGTNFYSDIINGKRKTEDLNLLCRVCNSLYYIESIGYVGLFKITYMPKLELLA